MWSVTDLQRAAATAVESRWGDLVAHVNEYAAARDAAGTPVPEAFFSRAGATGLQALSLPPPIGGGADPAQWIATLEHLGYLCRDYGFPLLLSNRALLAQALFDTGRRDLIDDYVTPIAHGELGIAVAYSEDADAFSLRTTLTRTKTAGRFVLEGHKDFVMGGGLAEVFLVYARTDTGDVSVCLVQRDDPGVTVTAADPLGTRTAAPVSLDLHAVQLSPERIVVDCDGLAHIQHLLGARRHTVCAAPLGRARALVEMTAARLASTTRHGQPLTALPNVQAALGRMYIAIEAARAMLYRVASRTPDQIDPVFDPPAAAAKHFIAEQVRYVLEQAIRVLGGQFYYGDPGFGACLRDFAGLVAVARTQDLLEVNLGALAAAQLAPQPLPDLEVARP